MTSCRSSSCWLLLCCCFGVFVFLLCLKKFWPSFCFFFLSLPRLSSGRCLCGRGETKNETGMFSAVSDTVFGGQSDGKKYSSDGTEVDDQGLPVGRDWYYYDEQLGRFSVRPEAPAHIREEHARQVAAMEAERAGIKTEVAPPPPPPPPPPSDSASPLPARLPHAPQYADSGFFSGK